VSNINWLVADQLGTPRMIFDKTGWLENVKRHDYLPFGEELAVGQGLRTTGLGYSGDTVRQKFTLKERDIETGLDYFLARYFASVANLRVARPAECCSGVWERRSRLKAIAQVSTWVVAGLGR
jgi:hypothetical protein